MAPRAAKTPAKPAKTASKTTVKSSKPAAKRAKAAAEPVRRAKTVKKSAEKAPEAANWVVEEVEAVPAGCFDPGSIGGLGEPKAGALIHEETDEDGSVFGPSLRKTNVPGVYINEAGIMVDSNGVILDFDKVKKQDDKHFERVIGRPLRTPVDLMEAVAMDPTKPLHIRLDQAAKVAPYTNRKKPIGIDGGEDGKPIGFMSVQELRGLSNEELQTFKTLLQKAANALALEDGTKE
jgi:hypothetical protein